jgi:hypothetical protein
MEEIQSPKVKYWSNQYLQIAPEKSYIYSECQEVSIFRPNVHLLYELWYIIHCTGNLTEEDLFASMSEFPIGVRILEAYLK